MKCHYIKVKGVGKVLIPGCMAVAISNDIADCTCTDILTEADFEQQRYKDVVDMMKKEIAELRQENKTITTMNDLKITATTEQEFKTQAYDIAKSVTTTDELAEFINFISNHPLDYGTAVYAQCAAMLAAQHVMNEGEQGGITGFQAGFIGWEMVKQFMSVGDCGLSIRDWENMLYPQYAEKFEKTISRKIFEGLQKKAKERLAQYNEDDSITGHSLHPEVRKHMESIVKGVVPFGYVLID